MLLAHPERLQHNDDLWSYCAGDEYHGLPRSGSPFDRVPYFGFSDDRLRFGTQFVGDTLVSFGSASGWVVPQS